MSAARSGAYAVWREMDSNRPSLGLVVRDTGADLHLWFRLYRFRWAYPEQVQWLRRSRSGDEASS